MKTTVKIIILFLFAVLLLNIFTETADFMTVNIDGEEFGGPLGWLVGLVFAGGGAVIATVVMLFVGLVLAVVFAGVGVILLGALGLGAVSLALLVSPLLLPLLLPLALVWYLVSRSRKARLAKPVAA